MAVSMNELLAANGYVVADGAMGTQLFAVGLGAGDPPEEWNVTHADEIRAIHRAYLQAGADLVVTNSFGGTRFRLALHEPSGQGGGAQRGRGPQRPHGS